MFVRPNNQRKEADAAKALLSHPDGDHLTLLNVYNSYKQSELVIVRNAILTDNTQLCCIDLDDKNWTWTNYLSGRSLMQADNVRSQLERIMERYEIDLLSTQDERKFYLNVRMALVCGFFMQVAHKEGEKGSYLTVKDNQVWTST